ncbi:MAG: glycosyl hydrolase [Betaproteobacteria bacterium]|nr:glycosyl hydrolase [Betaproteobacteria bacterium]
MIRLILLAAAIFLAPLQTAFATPPLPVTSWRGAAFSGDRAALEKLAATGANAVRVYHEWDAWVLDEARKLGIGVLMGLDVGLPRYGFRLDDPKAIAVQENRIRAFVQRYRNHPALLAWVIGNEVEHGIDDPLPAWREINRLAGVVKKLDPAHPTVMSVNDGSTQYMKQLAGCCTHIDMIGLNLYAGAAFGLEGRIRAAGIGKPLLITELGPLGQWQAGRKPWGAPVELTSREKAAYFRRVLAEMGKNPQVRGVFAFLWGVKQEQTATWHSLLLSDNTLTEITDALAEAWGRPSAKPAPTILGIGISADEFAPGAVVSSTIEVRGEAPVTGWLVRKEATELRGGGEAEPLPEAVGVEVLFAETSSIRFRAPSVPGAYRLFITVRDENGKAATGNLPFLVR